MRGEGRLLWWGGGVGGGGGGGGGGQWNGKKTVPLRIIIIITKIDVLEDIQGHVI